MITHLHSLEGALGTLLLLSCTSFVQLLVNDASGSLQASEESKVHVAVCSTSSKSVSWHLPYCWLLLDPFCGQQHQPPAWQRLWRDLVQC